MSSMLLSKRKSTKERFVIGIDGLGGSGKSTLATQLKQQLQTQNHEVLLFSIDDYIVKKKDRYHTGKDEWYEYYFLQWDVQLLRETLFEKIHSSHPAFQLPYYNKEKDSISMETHHVPTNCIIIIEGIFLQRKEWRPFLDFVLFIDYDKKIRWKRVLSRDTYIGDEISILNKYEKRYWPAEVYYMEQECPIQQANMIHTP